MVQVRDSKWSYLLGRLKEQSHKQRESFVINFILMNLLSDGYTDVLPILQQPIEKQDNKRELIDLYFPQINLGIEVDEDQHNQHDNVISDIKRYERIIKATNISYIQKRIDVNASRDLADIILDANQLVQLIKFQINQKRIDKDYDPWITMEERINNIKRNGVLKIAGHDYILWKTHRDVISLFSDTGWHISKQVQTAINTIKDGSKKTIGSIWFPKLLTDDEAYRINAKHPGQQQWANYVEGDYLLEHYLGNNFKDQYQPDTLPRLVFPYENNKMINYKGYKYLGRYVYDHTDYKGQINYYKYCGLAESTIDLKQHSF
ncbi:hypothetical protein FOD75_11495 (plasmid) [Limosilactobacillus reuteri]|uniref:Restriction endonuclease PvuRts1 I-like N-terminal domain-containing protein n=1 Tax=Limosilactobacillus reuteri TaxID=1598 RepID=A0A517D8Y5_LIMRT|nr:hypothetical protein [Limosilactobacillus reuteri]QDR73707.1 hypothetical protein FOD75_11495 [Limosilactobacillus reuteri]